MASSKNVHDMKLKLNKQCKELSEWVKKTVDGKAKRASENLVRLVEKQKSNMREAHGHLVSDMERRMHRKVAAVAKLKKRMDHLQASFSKVNLEALQQDLQACKKQINKALKARLEQVDQIKAEQERIMGSEFRKTVDKSTKLMQQKSGALDGAI